MNRDEQHYAVAFTIATILGILLAMLSAVAVVRLVYFSLAF